MQTIHALALAVIGLTWLAAWRVGSDLAVRIPPERLNPWNRSISASRAAEMLSEITSGASK